MYAKLLFLFFLVFAFNVQAEEIVQMVRVAPDIELETTIWKPDGPGPFPIVVMNHGKDMGPTYLQPRVSYPVLSKEFLKRGYAIILPMRKGFSKSSGSFSDYNCDLPLNGIKQADDIQLTLDYFSKQPWVDKNRILVAGHSFGGLATVAFGARNYPGVLATINFAGGLKYFWSLCKWREGLVSAMDLYGKTSQIPSLWFYGPTDSHFDAPLAREMFQAYTKNGAAASLVTELPFPYKNDPHSLPGWSDGPKFWWPAVENLLSLTGLPTELIAQAE